MCCLIYFETHLKDRVLEPLEAKRQKAEEVSSGRCLAAPPAGTKVGEAEAASCGACEKLSKLPFHSSTWVFETEAALGKNYSGQVM